MEFVDKQLALKLKEKGFDKPCFGWYHITTPPGAFEGRINLNTTARRGADYQYLLKRHFNEYSPNPNLVNALTKIAPAPYPSKSLCVIICAVLYFFATSVTNFIIMIGPIAKISSYLLPSFINFSKAFVTNPFSP